MHHHHHGDSQHENRTGLFVALLITTGIMILELVGGILSNSLALLSDSGHMLSDVAALALSLFALWFSTKPANHKKTYGYYRTEVIVALINGLSLFAIVAWIIWEAVFRLLHEQQIHAPTMMGVAIVGLSANIFSAWILHRKADVHHNLNMRSAYLHILSDALGSVGVIVAGVLIYFFSWHLADPIISLLVSLLIGKGAWRIVKKSLHILLEGSPNHAEFALIQEHLLKIEGVVGVHDLHIWTITSHFHCLTCHLSLTEEEDEQRVLQEAIDLLEQRFGIQHITLQLEKPRLQHATLTC